MLVLLICATLFAILAIVFFVLAGVLLADGETGAFWIIAIAIGLNAFSIACSLSYGEVREMRDQLAAYEEHVEAGESGIILDAYRDVASGMPSQDYVRHRRVIHKCVMERLNAKNP